MLQLGFYFDSTKCIGCRSCMMACKDKNDNPVDIDFRKVLTTEGGHFPNPWMYFISMSCNHCELPKCVEVCPYLASTKRKSDGLVMIDKTACIGCETCVPACPYGARTLNKTTQKMTKCNACVDLWLNDKSERPQCVKACGIGCLDFGDIEALKVKYSNLGAVKSLPDNSLTRPSLLVRPTVFGRK